MPNLSRARAAPARSDARAESFHNMVDNMPHDPSTCRRCRWVAEREGWNQRKESVFGAEILVWLNPKDDEEDELPSFCTSLDAVAGLMKELGEKDLGCFAYYNGSWCWFWPDEWPGSESAMPEWWYGWHGPEPIESEDYSCVIDAAMRVLDGKESDA